MVKSSRKGDHREREFAEKFWGSVKYKLSRKGYHGPDVGGKPMRLKSRVISFVEVKSKENLPDWLVGEGGDGKRPGWIPQAEQSGAQMVVFRQNRKPWYAIIKIEPDDFEEWEPFE